MAWLTGTSIWRSEVFRRERSAVCEHGVAVETEMAGRIRAVVGSAAGRVRSRLPVGGWCLRESWPREGQGCGTGCGCGPVRREEDRADSGGRPSRIGSVLVIAATETEQARSEMSPLGDRRRPSRHLGGDPKRLSGRRGTALLESPNSQCVGPDSEARPRPGQAAVDGDPLRGNLKECETKKTKFQDWCRRKGISEAARVLDEDWERMVSFYSFPKPHWQHLRSSNVVESPFAALRLRTDAAKRFKKIGSATATIFKLLLVAENHFRRLNAPALMREVHLGVRFEDGERVTESSEVAA